MNPKLIPLSILALCLCGCDGAVFVGGGRPYHREPEVVYRQPGRAYAYRPGPVVVAPAPRLLLVAPAPQPVYVAPQPVVVAPAPRPVFVAPAPQPVIVQPAPAPVYYEEGSVVSGVVVVAPPGITDYVFMNGGYYYWHPTLGIWVHARRAADWRPVGGGIHIYGSFSDHPAYRRGR